MEVPPVKPLVIAVLVLAAFVAPAAQAAPSAETTATRTFLARQKAARKVFQSALKGAGAEAALAVGAAEQALAATGNAPAGGEAVFAALRDFQGTVQNAMDAATAEQADAAADALATLPVPVIGIYPEAFYPTEGGAPTVFVDEGDLAKAYAKLRKRVARVAPRFAAEGFAFAFRVRPPKRFDALLWDEGGTEGIDGAFQPTVDLLVAWSDLAVTADVQLRAGGSSSQSPIDLNTANRDEMGPNPSDSDVPVVGDRFAADFGETALFEGLWKVYDATIESSDFVIGIR
jgi:hypothetical protein